MKSTFLSLFLILSTALSAQIDIISVKDDMTNEVIHYASHLFLSTNQERTQGFTIDPVLNTENSKIYVQGWIVKIYGFGNCNKENEIIILFDDGSNIKINSWNEFTCKNVAYFDPTLEQEVMLMTKRINKVRFTNGYTLQSFTGRPERSGYFFHLYDAIDKFNN